MKYYKVFCKKKFHNIQQWITEILRKKFCDRELLSFTMKFLSFTTQIAKVLICIPMYILKDEKHIIMKMIDYSKKNTKYNIKDNRFFDSIFNGKNKICSLRF